MSWWQRWFGANTTTSYVDSAGAPVPAPTADIVIPAVVVLPASAQDVVPAIPTPIVITPDILPPAFGTPSAACITLIQHMEGLSLTSFPDVDGVYVIGYGCKFADGKAVVQGQTIDAQGADRVCREKAQECATAILALVRRSLKQGQLDALVDFVYNCGIGALAGSTILRSIQATQPVTEDMFLRWNKIHHNGQLVVLPALTTRRQAEYRLWIS